MREYSVEEIRALADKNWSEAKLQKTTHAALKTFGWHYIHLRPAYTGVKWKAGAQAGKDMVITAYDGHAGFPDVVAMKGRVGLAWELKVGKNKATPEQLEWLRLFKLNGFDTRVCYPRDLEAMLEFLRDT